MDQNQPIQEAEASDAVVGGGVSLQPLVPTNGDPYMGLLDHRDVIGSVSDGESDVLLEE